MAAVIGIDFDNTIICYDDVFHRLALEANLVTAEAPRRQKAIRSAARQSPEGDVAWQRLQALAYGSRIHEASPAEGVLSFLQRCHVAGIEVHIISHKTRLASMDPTGTDLQEAARGWLAANGFFSEATGLTPQHFHCGITRQEKVVLIAEHRCTHFVDDLVETFREEAYPSQTQGILYAPGGEDLPEDVPGLWLARSWGQVTERIFHA